MAVDELHIKQRWFAFPESDAMTRLDYACKEPKIARIVTT